MGRTGLALLIQWESIITIRIKLIQSNSCPKPEDLLNPRQPSQVRSTFQTCSLKPKAEWQVPTWWACKSIHITKVSAEPCFQQWCKPIRNSRPTIVKGTPIIKLQTLTFLIQMQGRKFTSLKTIIRPQTPASRLQTSLFLPNSITVRFLTQAWSNMPMQG